MYNIKNYNLKSACLSVSKTKEAVKTMPSLLLLRNVKAHNLWNLRPTKADSMTCWPVSHIYDRPGAELQIWLFTTFLLSC